MGLPNGSTFMFFVNYDECGLTSGWQWYGVVYAMFAFGAQMFTQVRSWTFEPCTKMAFGGKSYGGTHVSHNTPVKS